MADQSLRILLVEDSATDARLVRLWLDRSSLRPAIDVVGDGQAAVEFLKNQPPYETAVRPDLVLLDLNLPKLSGFDVLSEIRRDEQLCRLPVIVLTASAIAEDVHRAHELEAERYLSKPSDVDGFHEMVEQIQTFWEDRRQERDFGF